MEIKVNYLDNLRQEAKFDDFSVIADQPIRYKGDGSAPGPFDYFLASSALCAAYFVKVYCAARDIPTDNIRLSQNNIVDPENRYKQIFKVFYVPLTVAPLKKSFKLAQNLLLKKLKALIPMRKHY